MVFFVLMMLFDMLMTIAVVMCISSIPIIAVFTTPAIMIVPAFGSLFVFNFFGLSFGPSLSPPSVGYDNAGVVLALLRG